MMESLNALLWHLPLMTRPQAKFFSWLIQTFLLIPGRINFRHLSRFGTYHERSIARQFES